jgi:hypothetical protein
LSPSVLSAQALALPQKNALADNLFHVLPLLFAMLGVMAASGLVGSWRSGQRCWTMVASYTSAALAAALFGYLIVRLGFSRGTAGANR